MYLTQVGKDFKISLDSDVTSTDTLLLGGMIMEYSIMVLIKLMMNLEKINLIHYISKLSQKIH